LTTVPAPTNPGFIEVLKANGIVPVHVGQKRPVTPSATLDKDDGGDQGEDNSEEIKALEVQPFLGTLYIL